MVDNLGLLLWLVVLLFVAIPDMFAVYGWIQMCNRLGQVVAIESCKNQLSLVLPGYSMLFCWYLIIACLFVIRGVSIFFFLVLIGCSITTT